MSISQHIQPIEYSFEEQKKIIFANIIKMLVERGTISGKNIDKILSDFKMNHINDDTYHIIIETPHKDDSNEYRIHLLTDQKILSGTKTSFIGDYIYKNTSVHKIIVVLDITQRAQQMIQMNFPLIEIFLKRELMINIVDHIYVPKHILLSNEDSEKVISEYGVHKKDLPRILVSDPISHYYWAKVGQIFRIIRPSEMTGSSVYYRIVVKDVGTKK